MTITTSEEQQNTHIDSNRSWYSNAGLAKASFWAILLLFTSSTTGYDEAMINGLQSLPRWAYYFGHPTRAKLGGIVSMINVGLFAGTLVAPTSSNFLGRKKTIFIANVIMIGGSALQAAAQSVGMFMGARFLIGIGLAFANSAAPLLLVELAYPPYRAALSTTYLGLTYVGAITAAWTIYGTARILDDWSWRIPSVVQAGIPLIQGSLICFSPESPTWLVSKGRDEEAWDILAYYHADGNRQDPLVLQELKVIKDSLQLDATKNGGYKALLTEKDNLKRLGVILGLAFFSQWTGVTIAAFYLSLILTQVGITKPVTQLLINAILSIWNLACVILGASLVDRVGRRPLFLLSISGVLVMLAAETICFALYIEIGSDGAAHAFIAFIFLSFGALNLAFVPLILTYTMETLPYRVRAEGVNMFFAAIALAAIFNAEVNPIALDAIGWKLMLIYTCWVGLGLIFAYFFIVETKGQSPDVGAGIVPDSERVGDHRDSVKSETDGDVNRRSTVKN